MSDSCASPVTPTPTTTAESYPRYGAISTLHGCGLVEGRSVEGIPMFRATDEGRADHKASRGDGWWKADVAKRLSDADPNRALIWTDDDLDYAERNGEVDWLRERTGPTLAIAPDTRQGITPKFMARIEAFLDRLREPIEEAV